MARNVSIMFQSIQKGKENCLILDSASNSIDRDTPISF